MPLLLDIYRFCRKAPAHPIVATRELVASQWARFAIIGFCASAAYYLLGLLFVSLLGLPLLVGNTVAYVLSFVVSYIGQAHWTFNTGRPLRETLPRFAAIQLIALLLNSLLIDFFCRKVYLPYPLAMFAAIIIVPIATYLVCKFWVFREKR